MGLLIRLAELLIVLVPLIGVIFAGLKAWGLAQSRREDEEDAALAPAPQQPVNQAARWRAITRAVKEHDRTEMRWLEYELDLSKLLDYPLMTDLREPATQRFHGARTQADLLRPAKAEDLLDDADAAREYRDAVEAYVTAFDVAEEEAMRLGRKGFTPDEQQRIARAQRALRTATDSAAAPQERDRAYGLARTDLDGLVVLPERSRAAIERGIAGELDG